MKYQFVILCEDDDFKATNLHNWVNSHCWIINQDYKWTSVIGYWNRIFEIILEVDDPDKAMLIKLTWM